MFVACPHCGYLVALIVAKDSARACPRCGGALDGGGGPAEIETEVETAAEAGAVAASAGTGDTPAPARQRAGTLPAPQAAAAEDEDGTETPAQAAAEAAPGAQAEAETVAVPAEEANTTEDAAKQTTEAAPLPPLTAAAAPSKPAPSKSAPRTPRRGDKAETAVSAARRAPSFARRQAHAAARKPRAHWSGPALVAVLALALALQLLLAQRAELAADARWRPLVAGLCSALPCTVPPWREPEALSMLNRNVLPVEGKPGVLRVNAGFRNDARWPQPWPVLVLSLEDVDGRRVGQRAFAPEEYRRGHRKGELIAPGQSAAVQFDVREPAPRVVAFTFDFR